MESSARDNKQKAFALVEKAHKASMKSIHSTTSNLDIGLKALQFTRDTSADVFLVCAGLLSGGAAWAALGGGAVEKERLSIRILRTSVPQCWRERRASPSG